MTINNKDTKQSNIVLFLLIFLSCSFATQMNVLNSSITILIWVATIVFLLFHIRKVSKRVALAAVFVLLSFWISFIVYEESTLNSLYITVAVVSAFLYVCVYSIDVFINSFRSVMKAICIISLVFFVLYLVFPSLNDRFIVYNSDGWKYSYLLIFVKQSALYRNSGLFWEPGAFQTFISLALLFEIMSKNYKIFNIVLFVVTLITTFSTAGFFSLLLLLIIPLLNNKVKNNKLKLFVASIIVVGGFLIYYNQSFLFDRSNTSAFGKLIMFMENTEYLTNTASSASIRYFSVVKPLEIFINSPIIGVGIKNLKDLTYNYVGGMVTCTFVNWFAAYGILMGFTMITGMISMARKFTKSLLISTIIVVFFFVISMAESYTHNAMFFILCFMGFSDKTLEGSIIWSNREPLTNNDSNLLQNRALLQ